MTQSAISHQLAVLKKLLRSPEVESRARRRVFRLLLKLFPLICLNECLIPFIRFIYIRLAGNLPRRMHIQHGHAAVEALREGFASLRPGADYDNLFASARCRSEADWLGAVRG